MSITGKQSADGLVYLSCPKSDCGAKLRIKPKSAHTNVTCANCGHKFVLDVADMGTPSGSTPAPPPLPPAVTEDANAFSFHDDAKPERAAPPLPRPKKVKQPWDVDDEDRQRERRNRREPEKTMPVGLIVGGGVAVALLLGGIAVGVVYATRDKEQTKSPVASAPNTARSTAAFSIPPAVETTAANEKSSPAPFPSTPKFSIPSLPSKGPEVTSPAPKTADSEPDDPPTLKDPPKKKGPGKKTPPPAVGDPIEIVKRSTAMIEAKGGWGTGFVIRPGIVMTNAHVIRGQHIDDLRVSFVSLDDTAPPGLKAVLLYTDPRRDLSILRVDTDRPPLEMTEAGTELSGMQVAVVGNPRGDAGQADINKVTTGKLSAPIRRDAGWTYYELSAQAYFGNSGGPVVDAKSGKVVGVMQSILGSGKQKSYCIPFGEANRALDTLPASKEQEPAVTKIAQARHYLDYIDDHLPAMENNAQLAMEGQLNRLRAKAFGGNVTVTLTTPDGRRQVFTLPEFMVFIKDKHTKTFPSFAKVMPMINASSEMPSSLRQLMRERIETYFSMYSLANQDTETEKSFLKHMEERKAAHLKKTGEFKDAYDKFLDVLERKAPAKSK